MYTTLTKQEIEELRAKLNEAIIANPIIGEHINLSHELDCMIAKYYK